MNAADVLLDRMRNGDLVTRQEIGIAVAFGAGRSHLRLSGRRAGISRRGHAVDGAMAGSAGGRVRIAHLRSASVRAASKFGDLPLMAFRAFCRREFRGRADFMHVSM